MAVQFHTLTVDDVTRETPDAISLTFNVPDELKPIFLYKAGQYITVRAIIDEVEHRRNYSLCSSPANNEPLCIAVKKVKDGAVSEWLNEHARPGMPIDVYPPMGNFTKEMSADHKKHYLMFAGGSGITPVLSITKTILRVEPKSRVTLFYANRNSKSIIFGDAIADLANKNNALKIVNVLEENGSPTNTQYYGRMDDAMVRRVISDFVPAFGDAEAFVCGPTGMMDSVVEALHKHGLDDKHIHREYFTLDRKGVGGSELMDTKTDMQASSGDKQVTAVEAEREEIITRIVRIRLYGEEHEFEVHPDETILLAAQRADLDPPYACQIGACCTCRAKIISGRVKMDEREALSDDEIEEGYALTCQSHPLTENVLADYDQ